MIEDKVDTVADRVVEYVDIHKKVKLNVVAKALALDVDEAERLAELLEKSGLLKIDYKFSGIELSSTKKEKIEKGEVKKKRADILESVKKSEQVFNFMAAEVSRRLKNIGERLNQFKGGDYSDEDIEKIKSEIDSTFKIIEHFKEQNELLESEEKELDKNLKLFRDRIKEIGASRSTSKHSLLSKLTDEFKTFFEGLYAKHKERRTVHKIKVKKTTSSKPIKNIKKSR